jgi:hypothetical protein
MNKVHQEAGEEVLLQGAAFGHEGGHDCRVVVGDSLAAVRSKEGGLFLKER